MRKTTEFKKSPLYTSKEDEAKKREIIKRLGKDTDGAFRAYSSVKGEV